MSRTKRKGDGPVPGVRNWAKGRIGVTRHRKADRAKPSNDLHRPDPDYPGYCWCGLKWEECRD